MFIERNLAVSLVYSCFVLCACLYVSVSVTGLRMAFSPLLNPAACSALNKLCLNKAQQNRGPPEKGHNTAQKSQ